MADKTTEVTPTLSDNPALNAVMAKYGITRGEMVAPQPDVVGKANFDELCTRHDTIYDNDGNVIKNVGGHSGPLVYLKTEEYGPDTIPDFKTKYESYIGFRVYTIFHPDRGEMVVTHGIPADGPTDLMRHLAKLDPGNLFQVASFPTSRGNRVFRAVPVQQS